jgi:hypothetical protein
MKKHGLGIAALFVALSFFANKSFAWDTVTATCVGGPDHPSYAFSNEGEAGDCAQRVGSMSEACKRDVRVAQCEAERRQVDGTPPEYCTCNPGTPAVGNW